MEKTHERAQKQNINCHSTNGFLPHMLMHTLLAVFFGRRRFDEMWCADQKYRDCGTRIVFPLCPAEETQQTAETPNCVTNNA